MVEIIIDNAKCIGCGACVNACPSSIFSISQDKAVLCASPDNCVLCRACESACPVGAIKIKE